VDRQGINFLATDARRSSFTTPVSIRRGRYRGQTAYAAGPLENLHPLVSKMWLRIPGRPRLSLMEIANVTSITSQQTAAQLELALHGNPIHGNASAARFG
jgi:hypothetical protein